MTSRCWKSNSIHLSRAPEARMFRLRDLSVRNRLLGMVLFSAGNLATVRVVCWCLLATYRVDGPVYARIMQEQRLVAEMEPAVLAIHHPFQLIQAMSLATRQEEIEALEQRLKEATL